MADLRAARREESESILRRYLLRADRLHWSPYVMLEDPEVLAVPNVGVLSAEELEAVTTVLMVEDHLPHYLSEYLDRFAATPDRELSTRNRHFLRFVFRWAAEEDRHSHALELYLLSTGLRQRDELERELAVAREAAFVFPFPDLMNAFVYLALQEKATQLYYRALCNSVRDPLLASILRRMSADEASHSSFFYEMLIETSREDLAMLSRRVSAVANEFRMPVQRTLDSYRRRVLSLFKAAPTYRHADVFADLSRAIEAASRKFGNDTLHLIQPAP